MYLDCTLKSQNCDENKCGAISFIFILTRHAFYQDFVGVYILGSLCTRIKLFFVTLDIFDSE